MAQMLEKQGIEFEHIFDEGGSILVDGIKGLLDKPLGLVGTAEKVQILPYTSEASFLAYGSAAHLHDLGKTACVDIRVWLVNG